MTTLPVSLTPQVARKMALEQAIDWMGTRWVLHPANYVRKLTVPLNEQGRKGKR
jgi:hypothetical protein